MHKIELKTACQMAETFGVMETMAMAGIPRIPWKSRRAVTGHPRECERNVEMKSQIYCDA